MSLDRLESALRLLGSLDPGSLPVHHAAILVWLAQRDSATYGEVEEAFNLSSAGASRTLNALSDHAQHRKTSGLGLVEIYRDPREGRRYRARLNKKGREFMKALGALVGAGITIPTTTNSNDDSDDTRQRQSA